MNQVTSENLIATKQKIFDLDLEPLKVKLQSVSEGPGWTLRKCDEVEFFYKNFLFLCVKYKDTGLVPSSDIDEFWHAHILDTRKYFDDCDSIFGGYLHHFPYLGLRGVSDEKTLHDMAESTADLYRKEFGVEYYLTDGAGLCKGCKSCGERGIDRLGQSEIRPYPIRDDAALA